MKNEGMVSLITLYGECIMDDNMSSNGYYINYKNY